MIVLGLLASEVVAATWSIRRWRAGSASIATPVAAAAVFALSLALAFGNIPSQVRSFVVGIALSRPSDISLMAVGLIGVPVDWLIVIALSRGHLRGRRTTLSRAAD
ncbi:MAG TPA: hypothetical protein VI056_02885 [Candidatus Limnocylindria bacterium]